MLVLISGLPHFGKKLAKELNANNEFMHFVFCDTYSLKWEQIKFILLLPFARAVISMNGVTSPSGSLSWVLRFRKKLIMQWMGTDLLNATQEYKQGKLFRTYIDYATHWVDAPWLKEEVEALELKADVVHFKKVNPTLLDKVYLELEVISYIPQARQSFYGLEAIAELAHQFPHLKFHLYGIEDAQVSLPTNVYCHGWIAESDFLLKLKQSAIFIRLTEHDGNSLSVIQALNAGCEVIWNYQAPCVHVVNESRSLKQAFIAALESVDERELQPNLNNHTFVATTYNEEHIRTAYLAKLKAVLSHD